MKHPIVIIFLLCVLCSPVQSQQWTIDYYGDYPQGRTHFSSGFVDHDGVTFLAGQQGPDYDTHETVVMRIEPDGTYTATSYHKEGFRSEAHCILETDDHQLFVIGRLINDDGDNLMILRFDKELHLLSESQVEHEVEALEFDHCTATIDAHGNIIVATAVLIPNEWNGTYYRGVFYKFDRQGQLLSHRYLIQDDPEPVYYLMNFRLRQLWYNEDNETLLCLVPGYSNVMSFITFDSAFNYLGEHPIWRDQGQNGDHTLHYDCFTDHWLSDDEALFFSSRGDHDHNKLRVSKVNTLGAFTTFIPLNERPDTIDDAAAWRCMATANDSTFYFSFYQHDICCIPGTAVVYRLNKDLDITGRYVDEQHDLFRSYLIFPTADGGCITVNDSCNMGGYLEYGHPKISKLNSTDFVTVHLTVTEKPVPESHAFPNPTSDILYIPIPTVESGAIRCRVSDPLGRIIIDRNLPNDGQLLQLDVSDLKAGTYYCQLYHAHKTLHTELFIKK